MIELVLLITLGKYAVKQKFLAGNGPAEMQDVPMAPATMVQSVAWSGGHYSLKRGGAQVF